MAAGKGMSWKWKLAIVIVILILVGIGFLFSMPGQKTMTGWIRDAYNQSPENERRTHPGADWWLLLAAFEAKLCWRDDVGMDMYKEFLAIKDHEKHGDFFKSVHVVGPQWNGFFDGKKKSGWGILHERAPEAYYNFLLIYQPLNTDQTTSLMAANYHLLFHELYKRYDPDKKYKPHPKFYKYWAKISDRMINRKYTTGKNLATDPKPPEYEGPIP